MSDFNIFIDQCKNHDDKMSNTEEEFDIKNNHKKYPPGDIRRFTDFAKVLTGSGKNHRNDDSPLGIAIRAQDQPILDTKREIQSMIANRLQAVADEVEGIDTEIFELHGKAGAPMLQEEIVELIKKHLSNE